MSGMYRCGNELYIGRKLDGSVRILKLLSGTVSPSFVPDVDQEYPGAILDVTLDPQCWISAVSSCTPQGCLRGVSVLVQELHLEGYLSEEAVERINSGGSP